MNEDKATRYQRQRRRAQAASVAVSGAVLALVASTGALRLRDVGAGLASMFVWVDPPPPLLTSLFVIMLLFALLGVVTLPFSLFRDWLLDRRYGLDRVSLRTWLATHAKGALVGVALAAGAVIVLHVSVALSAEWWWLIAGVALGSAQLGVTAALPWLLPFFARLRPLDRRELGERLDRLVRRAGAGTSLPVYEWRDDAAARRAQAALVGLGRTRRVLLSDTLLEAFGEDEIEVIVAHELAHHVHRDLWTAAVGRLITFVVGFRVADAWLARPTDPAALPLMLLVVGGVVVLTSPLLLAISRRQERQADAFSLRLTSNPEAFINVMRRMAALNLAEERTSPVVELLFSTHPSVNERVASARAWRQR